MVEFGLYHDVHTCNHSNNQRTMYSLVTVSFAGSETISSIILNMSGTDKHLLLWEKTTYTCPIGIITSSPFTVWYE